MNELDSMCGISDEELVEGRKCKNIDCGCGKKTSFDICRPLRER